MHAISRGFRVNYAAEGAGAPLVLIPGFLQSIERWAEMGYLERFSRRYRVIAVDPLGHGGSDKPHDPTAYLAEDCAADMLSVLDAEAIERAHIWGYSRGGALAVLAASLDPGRVMSLVVGGAPIKFLPTAPPVADWIRRQAAALRLGDWEGFWKTFGVILPPGIRSLLEEANDSVALGAVQEGSLLSEPQPDLSRVIERTLAYAGSREPLLALWQGGAQAAGADFHSFEGLDHASAFQEMDVVAPIVEGHLDKHSV